MNYEELVEGKQLAKQAIAYAMAVAHPNKTIGEIREAVKVLFGDEVDAALRDEMKPAA